MKSEYLSDKELERLIESASMEEVNAPADIADSVFKRIGGLSSDTFESHTGKSAVDDKAAYIDKKREAFRIYCFKVSISIAAAVIIMITSPYINKNIDKTPAKETVVVKAELSKQEALELSEYNEKGIIDRFKYRFLGK